VEVKMLNLVALFSAVILDFILKEPSSAYHPVAWFGKLMELIKKKVLLSAYSAAALRFLGLLTALLFSLGGYFLAFFLINTAANISFFLSFIGHSFFFWLAICFTDLIKRGLKIKQLLAAGDIKAARLAVGEIVGRNLSCAGEHELTRATVESLAENTVDGGFAPVFYGLVGGPPLAFAYRLINTLDAVFGYKNGNLRYFGWAAAKLDDLANFLPARLFAVCSGFITGVKQKNFFWFLKQTFADGLNHPSPNSGLAMAAVANCLNIKLGGLNDYSFTVVKVGPFNANGKESFGATVIVAEVRLLLTVYLFFLTASLLTQVLLLHLRI